MNRTSTAPFFNAEGEKSATTRNDTMKVQDMNTTMRSGLKTEKENIKDNKYVNFLETRM